MAHGRSHKCRALGLVRVCRGSNLITLDILIINLLPVTLRVGLQIFMDLLHPSTVYQLMQASTVCSKLHSCKKTLAILQTMPAITRHAPPGLGNMILVEHHLQMPGPQAKQDMVVDQKSCSHNAIIEEIPIIFPSRPTRTRSNVP